MKLFSSPTSPYARKVRVMIIELGLEESIAIENVTPMENPAVLHAANPLGKIPALELGDGRVLFDSPVICEYLDTENGHRFVPASGSERFDVLCRAAFGDGLMDAAFNRTMERLRPQGEQSTLWLGRWRDAINRSVDALNGNVPPDDRFDYGDVAVACALGYLDLRHHDLNWRSGRNRLAGWFETISARPSMAATVPA